LERAAGSSIRRLTLRYLFGMELEIWNRDELCTDGLGTVAFGDDKPECAVRECWLRGRRLSRAALGEARWGGYKGSGGFSETGADLRESPDSAVAS
jgi:hypothetical protein